MGQLLRLIIILIGLWLVLTIIKRAVASLKKPPPNKVAVAKMVACAHCGLHIPESEAVQDGDRHYCCEEHLKKPRT
jgi:uncharacterized protein